MSDRCYEEVTLRKRDYAAVGHERTRMNWPEIVEEKEGSEVIRVSDPEAPWARTVDLEALMRAGIPFYGWHGPGDSYSPEVFACDGAQVCFARCLPPGQYPVVQVLEDGSLYAPDMREALKYHEILARVKLLLQE